jgi:L-methionine (R)-S-oxide reductase
LAETILLNKEATSEEQYRLLLKQIKSLLAKDDNLLSNLSNFTAALKQSFEKISWAGFYLYDGKELYLGPFQGKVACTKIRIGSGVCGTSAEKRMTLIVPDVDKFPGHIACDVESKSEIVIPIIKDDELYGVLDLDSTSLNSFNQVDQKYLEEMVNFIVNEIL